MYLVAIPMKPRRNPTQCSSAKRSPEATLSLSRRERARRQAGPPALDPRAGPQGCPPGQRPARSADRLFRAPLRAVHGAFRHGGRASRLHPYRRAPAVRAALGASEPWRGPERARERPRLRVRPRAGRLRQRPAPPVRLRLRPLVREVDGRLRHPRRGRPAPAPPLSGDGLVGRGARAGRRRRSRAALCEERDRGAAVRTSTGSLHRPVAGLHGHHHLVVPRCGRGQPGGARPFQGSPAGPSADGTGGGARRRGPSDLVALVLGHSSFSS